MSTQIRIFMYMWTLVVLAMIVCTSGCVTARRLHKDQKIYWDRGQKSGIDQARLLYQQNLENIVGDRNDQRDRATDLERDVVDLQSRYDALMTGYNNCVEASHVAKPAPKKKSVKKAKRG